METKPRVLTFTVQIDDEGLPSKFNLNGGSVMPSTDLISAMGYAAGALHGVAHNTIEAMPASNDEQIALHGIFAIAHDATMSDVMHKDGVTGSIMSTARKPQE